MNTIKEFVEQEPLFSTHDHQCGYEFPWKLVNYSDMLSYAIADIHTAGFNSPWGKAEDIFDVWQYVKTTGYGQAVDFTTKKLFGMSFSRDTCQSITEKLQAMIQSTSPKELYEKMYALANVKWVINDSNGGKISPQKHFSNDLFPDFFKCAMRFGRAQILNISTKKQIQDLEKDMDWAIHSLADLDRLMDEYTLQAFQTGNLAALKIAVAYNRSLNFEETCTAKASQIFEKILLGKPVEAKPLHDYLIHKILQRAETLKLPIQIHTGFLAGNSEDFRQGEPTALIPIFQKYHQVRFDMFHAAWPYSSCFMALAKGFPNVWADMCWAWAVNPVQMERVLDEMLSCVPCNKIFAFGADVDSGLPFPVIGYAHQARRGIGNVLARKIASGEYDYDTAKFVAKRIMHENAESFFCL